MVEDGAIHIHTAWFDCDVITGNSDYPFYELLFFFCQQLREHGIRQITVLNRSYAIDDSVYNNPVVDIECWLHRACRNMEGEDDKGPDD